MGDRVLGKEDDWTQLQMANTRKRSRGNLPKETNKLYISGEDFRHPSSNGAQSLATSMRICGKGGTLVESGRNSYRLQCESQPP